jgi:hypothetical protein
MFASFLYTMVTRGLGVSFPKYIPAVHASLTLVTVTKLAMLFLALKATVTFLVLVVVLMLLVVALIAQSFKVFIRMLAFFIHLLLLPPTSYQGYGQ